MRDMVLLIATVLLFAYGYTVMGRIDRCLEKREEPPESGQAEEEAGGDP